MKYQYSEKWIFVTDDFIAGLIKKLVLLPNRIKMNDIDYPGIFELTPFEKWCIEEIEKAAKQFRKRFF